MATNIDDLPNNDKPNISLENTDRPVQYNPNNIAPKNKEVQQPNQLSQNDIDKIVSQIQKAGDQKLTELPIRDVPTNTQASNITNDPNIQPNYIPDNETQKYIPQQNIFEMNNNPNNKKEDYLDEFQIPIIISLIFFLLQLPFFNNLLSKYMNFLFLNDGNITNSGLFIKSLIGGILFYIINKGLSYVNNM